MGTARRRQEIGHKIVTKCRGKEGEKGECAGCGVGERKPP